MERPHAGYEEKWGQPTDGYPGARAAPPKCIYGATHGNNSQLRSLRNCVTDLAFSLRRSTRAGQPRQGRRH